MKTDIPYALDLLKRINGITINEAPIYSFFSKYYNGDAHSFWASQMFSLFCDVKVFSAEKNFEKFLSGEAKNTFLHSLKYTAALLIAFVVSMLFLLKTKMGGYRVLVYSPDKLKKGTGRDPRLFQIYPVFNEENVSYGEVIHTLLNREFLLNFFKRKRLVFYLESLSLPYFFLRNGKKENEYRSELSKASLAHFSKEELPFVNYVLEKYLKRCLLSEFRIAFFSRMLQGSGIQKLFTIDDARYANELIVGARIAGVKVLMFQHSNFDYFYGLDALPPSLYAFPDTFFVWNDYWMKRLPELSPLFSFHKNRLKIGGRAYSYQVPVIRPATPSFEGKLQVFLPYEVNTDKEKMRKYVEKVLKCPNTKLFFSIRPDVSNRDFQLKEYGIDEHLPKEKLEILTSLPENIFENIHIVLGVYSGLLDEMIERAIPVAILRSGYTTFNDLSQDGLVDYLSLDEGNICEKLLIIARTPKERLIVHQERFLRGAGNVKTIVSDIIQNLK